MFCKTTLLRNRIPAMGRTDSLPWFRVMIRPADCSTMFSTTSHTIWKSSSGRPNLFTLKKSRGRRYFYVDSLWSRQSSTTDFFLFDRARASLKPPWLTWIGLRWRMAPTLLDFSSKSRLPELYSPLASSRRSMLSGLSAFRWRDVECSRSPPVPDLPHIGFGQPGSSPSDPALQRPGRPS